KFILSQKRSLMPRCKGASLRFPGVLEGQTHAAARIHGTRRWRCGDMAIRYLRATAGSDAPGRRAHEPWCRRSRGTSSTQDVLARAAIAGSKARTCVSILAGVKAKPSVFAHAQPN